MARCLAPRRAGAGAARPVSAPPVSDPRNEGLDEASATAPADRCWLCARPLGLRVEWHHPCPKSRGGRVTVPVHPICHRALHAAFSNIELARLEAERQPPAEQPALQDFFAWIAGKPPDFHAPTRKPKREPRMGRDPKRDR